MGLIEAAKKINQKGNAFIAKNGIKDFHKKASELLASARLADLYNFEELVNLSLTAKHPQHFKHLEFSDLPLTIVLGEHCFIDLYFWRRRPTVIHNHHFAGAFMCLTGNNVDLEFTFMKERKLGKFHDLGRLELKRTAQMVAGDITEIGFMDKFIHQNHHQAELTVNLCFRTPQAPGKSLSNYLYSGLRYEKNMELLARVNRLLRFVDIGHFDPAKIPVSDDDAINFLIQTYDSNPAHKNLQKVRKVLDKRVRDHLGVDVSRLIRIHDKRMNELESEYE